MAEQVDRRVLGAVRAVDRATGRIVSARLSVTAPGVRFVRNRSNLYVVFAAPGLDAHTWAFERPPRHPRLRTVLATASITDPTGRYLPRTFALRLPRDPAPQRRGEPDSLFTPVEVALYPAAAAPIGNNWSTVRARIATAVGAAPGALLRVVRPGDGTVLGSGIADRRGEALVVVPGVPITNFSEEEADGEDGGDAEAPVVVSEVPARLEVSLRAGATWPVDPDELEQDHAAALRATRDITLRTGRTERVSVELSP